MEQLVAKKPMRILSLDGGGSLGVYTLGVLVELEAALASPLKQNLDMVFGTSTGSIIACQIADGVAISDIYSEYLKIAPEIFGPWSAGGRSAKLAHHAERTFGEKTFGDFDIHVGVVTTDLEFNRPMIFKSNIQQAHGQQATFKPGFDCKVADAVRASCSAYPIFEKCTLQTSAGLKTLVDGGFSANNPALFSLVDALGPLGFRPKDIRLCSIGTGVFPIRKHWTQNIGIVDTITTLLGTNANSLDGLRKLLYGHVPCVRISDSAASDNYRTNLAEKDLTTLRRIYEFGRKSFNEAQDEVLALFK